jgi:hypothetical protein
MFSAVRAVFFLGGLVAVASLPLVGRALRSDGGERCAFNGVTIRAATRVRVVEAGGRERLFCCVDCARRWLAAAGSRPAEILATDETTGLEVRAGDAWFVSSRVPAFAVCGSHVHVFAHEADARRHAEAFGGRVLEGADRPLRTGEGAGR